MSKSIMVFEIYNLDTKETFYVQNKEQFCLEHNLTRRLLDRTRAGERTHHKRYVLRQGKFQFIESDDGDKYVYGTTLRGYIIPVVEQRKSEEELVDKELAIANRKIQKLQDQVRILRKINREQNRQMSISDDFIETVVELLDNKKVWNKGKYQQPKEADKTLLIQLSDLHFGKVVDLPHNKFNFLVARERLIKYAQEIIRYTKSFNITNSVVCFTGDMTNLDSHFDSLLTNESNRANNFVTALDIMSEFLDILSDNLNVKCIGVIGNESRIRTTEYQSNNDKIASNNFDTLLFKVLKRTHKHIGWIGECDKLNDVICIQGKNILLTHGDKIKHTKDEVLKLKYRIMEQIGNKIDYVIFGHIHSTLITSNYARSSSIVGSDEYSSNNLNISESVVAQNIYIVDDKITPIEIKL
jgi:predicted phosphodiesterase